MTITEATRELYQLDTDIEKLNREINNMKSSGNIMTGIQVDGIEKREYIDNVLDALTDLEQKYSMVKTARNNANAKVRIEIDKDTMSLNSALTKLESLQREITRYTGYSGFQSIGNASGYYDEHVHSKAMEKQDYYLRLKEVVNKANTKETIVLD